jgi:hypothetical protein
LFNGLTFTEQIQTALLNSSAGMAITPQLNQTPMLETNRRSSNATGSSTNNSAKMSGNRKRKLEESQLEIIEMKKELIKLQQMAFERQISMCHEVVETLKEMRSWLELQRRTSILTSSTPAPTLQSLNLSNSSVIPNYSFNGSGQLSAANLNTLTSLLANAASAAAINSPHQQFV